MAKAKGTNTIRVKQELINDAKKTGQEQDRGIRAQIERWIRAGQKAIGSD